MTGHGDERDGGQVISRGPVILKARHCCAGNLGMETPLGCDWCDSDATGTLIDLLSIQVPEDEPGYSDWAISLDSLTGLIGFTTPWSSSSS